MKYLVISYFTNPPSVLEKDVNTLLGRGLDDTSSIIAKELLGPTVSAEMTGDLLCDHARIMVGGRLLRNEDLVASYGYEGKAPVCCVPVGPCFCADD